jgi:hypothetical protein
MVKAFILSTLLAYHSTNCTDKNIADMLTSRDWDINKYIEDWVNESLGHYKFVRSGDAAGRFVVISSGKKGDWSIEYNEKKQYYLKLKYDRIEDGGTLRYEIQCPMDHTLVTLNFDKGYAKESVSIKLTPATK